MKYVVMFFGIASFAASPLLIQQSFAQCFINEDWPQAPCLDNPINGCYGSEDIKMWMKYYDYKGESLMESKKSEMMDAFEANQLSEWQSQSSENFNVWQYYYLNGEIPDFDGGAYLCNTQFVPEVELLPETNIKYGKSFTIHAWFPEYENLPENLRFHVDVLDSKHNQIDSTLWFARQDFVYEFDTTHPAYNITKGGTYYIKIEKTDQMQRTGTFYKTLEFQISFFDDYVSPLKQIKSGVALMDIKCDEKKHPVYKYNRIRVACVTEETQKALLQRGWALLKNEQSNISSFPAITDEKMVNNARLSIAYEVIGGEKYFVFHGYGWHRLHNVEIIIANSGEKITSIRSKTNENGILYMPWLLPSSLQNGVYTIYATDGINQNESTISIPVGVPSQSKYDSSELEVEVTGERQVRRGTTHIIEVQVNRDETPVDDAQVFIHIEDYGEKAIRKFNGRTNQQGYFVFSWEIPKEFDDIKTLLAFVDVTDGISSKTVLFKFYVYCLPGEKNCKVKGN